MLDLFDYSPIFHLGYFLVDNLHCTVSLCHVAVWHMLRRLIADTDLETGRTPVNKLDSLLGPGNGNGRVDFLGDDVATVEQTGRHVFAILRVAFDHLVAWVETSQGHFTDSVCLVGCPRVLGDGCVGKHGEVNTREWNEISLEFSQVDVKVATETDRCSNRRDNYMIVSLFFLFFLLLNRCYLETYLPCATRRFKFSKPGRSMVSCLVQIS